MWSVGSELSGNECEIPAPQARHAKELAQEAAFIALQVDRESLRCEYNSVSKVSQCLHTEVKSHEL